MAKAKHGDTVKVHYTGVLEDGTIFETIRKKQSCLEDMFNKNFSLKEEAGLLKDSHL